MNAIVTSSGRYETLSLRQLRAVCCNFFKCTVSFVQMLTKPILTYSDLG